MENGLVKVISPIDDTPAQKAGMQPGDLVTHLDGEPVLGLTLEQAVERMRGPVDSDIKLTVQREGLDASLDVSITRAIIKIRSVRTRMEGEDVGYLRVSSFSEKTYEELEKAVMNMRDEHGENITGFVLDLRNNPGGLLDQAVAVSDAFLPRGEIVSTRGRRSDSIQRFNAKDGDVTGGKPLVVLINGGSASASEIVAGALQGSPSRARAGHAVIRQRLSSDRDTPRRAWCHASHHGAVLHALRPIHSGQRHRPRHRR